MGIIPEPKYNANNPPPFHLNVTEPKSYGYPVNEDYGFNNNPIYQKKMNNIETSNKDYYNNNQNFNYKQNKNTIGNNNLLNEGINKGKSKKDDFSIDINILTKDKVEVMIPIKIGKNVWIGKNVCIMPNVTIGDYAIIGANAVVTHDIPAYAIAAGCPARVIKMIE